MAQDQFFFFFFFSVPEYLFKTNTHLHNLTAGMCLAASIIISDPELFSGSSRLHNAPVDAANTHSRSVHN